MSRDTLIIPQKQHTTTISAIILVAICIIYIFVAALPVLAQEVDAEPPVITINNPPADPSPFVVYEPQITLDAVVTDNHQIRTVSMTINRPSGDGRVLEHVEICGTFALPRCPATRLELPMFSPEKANIRLEPGQNNIFMYVYDEARLRIDTIRRIIYQTDRRPVIQFVSPRPGAVLSENPVIVEADVQGAGLRLDTVTMEVQNDRGSTVVAICGGEAPACPGNSVNTLAFAPDRSRAVLFQGENRIIIRAVDERGNAGESTIQVTYAPPVSELPKIIFRTPLPDVTLPTERITVDALISSASAIESVIMSIRREGSEIVEERPLCGAEGVPACPGVSFALSDIEPHLPGAVPERLRVPLVRGDNHITITATNNNGFMQSFRKVRYDPDYHGPAIDVFEPVEEVSYTQSNNQIVEFEVTSLNPLQSVLIRIIHEGEAGIPEVREHQQCGPDAPPRCRLFKVKRSGYGGVGLSGGNNQFTIIARDEAGLETTHDFRVIRDNIAPTISFDLPSPYTTAALGFLLPAHISDNIGLQSVSLLIDRPGAAREQRNICGLPSAAPCPTEVILPTFNRELSQMILHEGSNTIKVSAEDIAGNRADWTLTAIVETTLLVTADHTPHEPRRGEAITVHANARLSGARPLRLTIMEIKPDGILPQAACGTAEPVNELECNWRIEPRAERLIKYIVTAEYDSGHTVSSPVRSIYVGNVGQDSDYDGLVDAIEDLICTDPHNPDSDRDSLEDGWETVGIKTTDGRLLDLQAMGASPCLKDAFVEIDWYEGPGINQKPSTTTLQKATAIGRRAGFFYHFDVGNFGGGTAIPPTKPNGQPYIESYKEFMARRFQNFDLHRSWAFHYALSTPTGGQYKGSKTSSVRNSAYSITHEVGHSFGLGHGGGYASEISVLGVYIGGVLGYPFSGIGTNFKPNYLSLMNYQTPKFYNPDSGELIGDLKYSDVALPDLDERNLDERPTSAFATALRTIRPPSGVSEHLEPVTRYTCIDARDGILYTIMTNGLRTVLQKVQGVGEFVEGPPHDPGIDWNCNGIIEGSVSHDINADDTLSVLYASADVALIPGFYPICRVRSVMFEGQQYPSDAEFESVKRIWGSGFISLPRCDEPEIEEPPHDSPPPTEDEFEPFLERCDGTDDNRNGRIDEGCPDRDGDGFTDDIDNCPLDPNPDQLDLNRDQIGDRCAGLLPAPSRVTPAQSGDTMTLSWTPDAHAIGYTIYRRVAGETDFRYLGTSYPSTKTSQFIDSRTTEKMYTTSTTGTMSTGSMGTYNTTMPGYVEYMMGMYNTTMPGYVEYMVRAVSYTTGQEGLPTVVKIDFSTMSGTKTSPTTSYPTGSLTGNLITFFRPASARINAFPPSTMIPAVIVLLVSMMVILMITTKFKRKN